MSGFTRETLRTALVQVQKMWLDCLQEYGAGHPETNRWSVQVDLIAAQLEQKEAIDDA